MILKEYRKRASTLKSHTLKIGQDANKFLEQLRTKNEGEVIDFRVKGYSNPIYLRNKTSDIPTFYQCIFDKEYDIEIDFTPEVIVDLGANIGLTSAFFISKYPNVRIIALEPEDSNFEVLKMNLGPYKKVDLLQGGIWNKKAHLEIVDDGLGHYGFTVKEVPGKTSTSIDSWGVEDIINDFELDRIDILKIDIEGSEKELFQSNTQGWLSKVGVLIVELHDHMKKGCSKALFDALRDYQYNMKIKGENLVITFSH